MRYSSFSRLAAVALLLCSSLVLRAADAPADPTVAPPPEPVAPPARAPLNPALPSIFVAGDSTAASGGGGTQGWGVPFAEYFDTDKANIANRARGGRSSRTFITEGLWDQLIADVKAGDFVLIQFGHNDGGAINEEPPGSNRPLRARGSLPGLGEESQAIDNAVTKKPEVVQTFGWYMRKMISDVKAKQATPILLSLTVRNYWRDDGLERGSGRYGEWTREIAAAERVAFIDLTNIVADQLTARGQEETNKLYRPDRTHTNADGADFHARHVVAGLKALRGNRFSGLLNARGTAIAAAPENLIAQAPRVPMRLPEPANPALPSVILIGDSTVRNGRGDGANGQWGWGDFLASYLDTTKINIVNRAVGGLSSRTFLTQGHWERALAFVKPGDLVVMQFGHNDNGAINDTSRARGTIKGVGEESEAIDNLLTQRHEVVHSYGWYLRKFVADARAKGAIPIICSLVPRKIWVDGKIRRDHDNYAGWAEAVARAERVAFLDLNEIIAQRYDALGAEKVEPLFGDAHTHTSQAGAELNATCVVASLKALAQNPLAAFLTPAAQGISEARLQK